MNDPWSLKRTIRTTFHKFNYYRNIFKNILGINDPNICAWIALTSAFVIGGGLIGGVAPLTLKGVIDSLTGRQAGAVETASVVVPILLYATALAAQRILEPVQTYFYTRVEQRFVRNFASGAYGHLLALPLSVHLEKRSGSLAQSITQGILGLRLVATHLVLTIAPVIVQLVVAIIILARVSDATMAGLLLGGLLLYCAAFGFGVARLQTPLKDISARQLDAGGLAADGLMNVEAIKAYTAERRFAGRYEALLQATEGGWARFAGRRLENGVAVALVFGISFASVLLVAGYETASGRLSLGGFVLINTYVLQLVRPVEMIGFAIRDIGQGLAFLKEIADILAMPSEEIADEDIALPSPAHPASLAFERVSFGHGDRTTIDGISFTASPGQFIGIVGPSGAGKSSLLRLILRLYDPWEGAILLDGVPLSGIPLRQLRRQIALVSQDTILFHDTISANIRFAVEEADDEAVAAAVARAHLSALLDDLPDGLDTLVGERGLKLSGGEKQRVSIARAALKQARLIIFDEATAALDPATERAVWSAMRGLAQGATTLVVTHRLSTVKDADQILVLEHGKIAERGTHSELVGADGVYAGLWRAQEGVVRQAADRSASGQVRGSSPGKR